MQPVYRPLRDRDAYPTIRGYVYQVDRTVERWLNLSEGFCLELERGEDIDLDPIGSALATEDVVEQARLLEQVKHRERNVTLRDASALEALANAVEHLNENQALKLQFCYTTNAAIGREKLCPFPNRTPGITLWEQIRLGQLASGNVSEALRSLRLFLQNQARPEKVPEGVWASLQGFLSQRDEGGFSDLVSRFEWSTGQISSGDYPRRLADHLLERGLAANEAEAQALYERLFLHVLRLLCQAGVKRLTREDLSAQLVARALPAADRGLMRLLRQCLEETDRRVEVVEEAVGSLAEDVRLLAERAGVTGRFEVASPIPDVGLPPQVERLSERRETVARLLETIGSHTWTALYGGPDTGKSQLVLLAASRLGTTRGWVRFTHSMRLDAACRHLDSALAQVSGLDPTAAAADGYRTACARLGGRSLLVLDDLPRTAGDEPFSERLTLLARACRESGCKLVSTSQHLLPTRLERETPKGTVLEMAVPLFANEESRELFLAHGAPVDRLPQATVRFVNSVARGHPLLLTLAADFLRERDWRLEEEEFDALLRGAHAEPLQTEIMGRLAERLGEPQRELLFRLTLVIGSFTTQEVTALSRVAPEITQPQVRLSDLLGAWVQRESVFRMVVSPLVSGMGRDNLGASTRVACHRVLADLIVQGRMNQYQAQHAIAHNLAAEEYRRAATLYLVLLDAVRRHPGVPDVGSILEMWASTSLPEKLDIGMQLCVRGYQLFVFSAHSRSVSFVLSDIDRLLGRATEDDGWGVATVAIYSAGHLASSDPDRTLRYLNHALSLQTIRRVDGRDMTFPKELRVDDLLWSVVPHLNTPERLKAWLLVVGRLPGRRRERLFRTRMGREGVLVIPDSLIHVEMAKPKEERDWGPVIQAIDDLEAWGKTRSLPTVQIAAIRSLITVYGDLLRQIDQIASRALAALDALRGIPEATFFIAGSLGRHYTLVARHDEARPLLKRALAETVEGHDYERMLYLLAASHSFGEESPETGLLYARQAADIARPARRILPIEAARALAEQAVAKFLSAGGQAGARLIYADWSEATERLLKAADESTAWQDLIVVFAHTTSYLASLAKDGTPPDKARDGGEFIAPRRGWFMLIGAQRAGLYFPGSRVGLLWLMARYAEAADEQSEALTWMSRAADATEEVPGSYIEAAIGLELVPALVAADRYEEALQAGVHGSRAMVVMRSRKGSPFEELFRPGRDPSAEVSALNDEEARQAEHFAVISALVPVVLRIARRSLEDRAGAFTSGQHVSSLCRQFVSVSCLPELWTSAADVFSQGCSESGSTERLVELGNSFDAGADPELRVLAYLASSMHSAPFDAFCAHVACMERVYGWYSTDSATYRLIVLPYIEDFWTRVVEHSRFYFSAPTLVVEAMAQARSADEAERGKAILRAVRLGFFRYPRGIQQALAWLSS